MANNYLEYVVTRNAKLTALITLLNSGKLKIYTGTQPATEGAITGTLLATLVLNSTAGTVSGGVLTFNAITSDTNAANTGTAGYAVLEESDGTTVLATGSVGTSSADFVLDTLSITAGSTVACTAGTLTAPA